MNGSDKKIKAVPGFIKDLKKLKLNPKSIGLEEGEYESSIWEEVKWFFGRIFGKIKDIPREIKWFWQRGKRGYSDCDVWDLNDYLLSWLPKAIRELRDNTQGYPAYIKSFNEWKKILTKMANGLESGQEMMWNTETKKKIEKLDKEFKEGMRLLEKHFFNLWD